MSTATQSASTSCPPTPGTFCWHELATGFPEKAIPFYKALAGWAFHECPQDNRYIEFEVAGRRIGGIRRLESGDPTPAHWSQYIATADIRATCARVVEHGGTVLAGPSQCGDIGWFATVKDTTDAVVQLFQGGCGGGVHLHAGIFCWNELCVHDTGKAKAFWSAVLGWEWADKPMGEAGDYTMFRLKGSDPSDKYATTCGMMKITPEMGPMPPSWTGYIWVDDIEKTTARVAEHGGVVIVPVMPIPGIGSFSIFKDPTGAVAAFYQPLINPTGSCG